MPANDGEETLRNLRGKKALVTGAASGIGRDISLALAREGVHLYLLDIDGAGLAQVAAEASAHGIEAIGAPCDLIERAQVTATLAQLRNNWGALDLLVNNAGVAYYGPTEHMTQAQWDWIMGVNLLAPIQITHELLPLLLEQPEAHILNVCSVGGLIAAGRFCAYNVSKFGLVGFSEALRAEFGRRGVGVTALCPGFVLTNMFRNAKSGRRDGTVPVPPRWVCTDSDRVARAAISAIRRNRRMVILSPAGRLAFNLKRFAPWLLDRLSHVRRSKRPTRRPRLECFESRDTKVTSHRSGSPGS